MPFLSEYTSYDFPTSFSLMQTQACESCQHPKGTGEAVAAGLLESSSPAHGARRLRHAHFGAAASSCPQRTIAWQHPLSETRVTPIGPKLALSRTLQMQAAPGSQRLRHTHASGAVGRGPRIAPTLSRWPLTAWRPNRRQEQANGPGNRLQCSASHAAAAAAAHTPPADGGATPSARCWQPLLPPGVARAARVAGAAAAFVVWYNLAAACQGPFASLGLAAAAPANEGAVLPLLLYLPVPRGAPRSAV